MKKLLVILSAVALVAAFSLPVLAGGPCPTDPTQLQGQGQGQLSLQGQLQGQGQGQLQGQTQYSNDANFNSNGNCNTNKNSNTNSNFDAAVADAQTSACVDVNVNVPPIASACNDINLKQENCIDCAYIGNATGGSRRPWRLGPGYHCCYCRCQQRSGFLYRRQFSSASDVGAAAADVSTLRPFCRARLMAAAAAQRPPTSTSPTP